jgi:hypothetical protein
MCDVSLCGNLISVRRQFERSPPVGVRLASRIMNEWSNSPLLRVVTKSSGSRKMHGAISCSQTAI